MKVAGLFAGIGGIEYGLHNHDINTHFLCEIMAEAQAVLRSQFNGIRIVNDVTKLKGIGKVDILCGGFPCQDISIAGTKVGVNGERSSLVNEIFRLIRSRKNDKPKYVLIENVANIISLHKGEALKLITRELQDLGYNWAYRLVDPRSFGIPQRRPRFILLASNERHPKNILFPENENVDAIIEDRLDLNSNASAYGFYWTEGRLGIGWAKDSVPPLKCGSSLGLPSAPAVWDIENNFFGTPTIEDAERLQGFPENWTKPIEIEGFRNSGRWKLIGNAVNTRVSNWVGGQIVNEVFYNIDNNKICLHNRKDWPKAAYNDGEKVYGIKASYYPQGINYEPILDFLNYPLKPLSLKAALGFKNRCLKSTIVVYPQTFLNSLDTFMLNLYGTNQ